MKKTDNSMFPINTNDIYCGKVFRLELDNQLTELRNIIYENKNHTGNPIYDNIIDIFYDTRTYISYPDIENFDYRKVSSPKMWPILVGNGISLYPLLMKFGFNEVLNTPSELKAIMKNLFNGRFAYENYELFGYEKKTTYIWKNGLKVPNPDLKGINEYCIDYYESVDKDNELATYFPILCETNFEPTEEGQIKKRILR